MFQLIFPLAFFQCLSNSVTYMELQTTSFIESTGVVCCDSSKKFTQLSGGTLIGLYTPIIYFGWYATCSQQQRWQTLTNSVSGNLWPGEPRDLLRTTSARKFSSCVWSHLQDAYFSINTSFSNTLPLFFTQFLHSDNTLPPV